MGITLPQRAAGSYYRADIQKDVLYGHYRHKEISMTLHRVTGVVTGFTDSLAKQLCAMGIVGQETLTAYETAVTQEMAPFTQWDPWGSSFWVLKLWKNTGIPLHLSPLHLPSSIKVPNGTACCRLRKR